MIPTEGFDSKECECGEDVEPHIYEDPPESCKVVWKCFCGNIVYSKRLP